MLMGWAWLGVCRWRREVALDRGRSGSICCCLRQELTLTDGKVLVVRTLCCEGFCKEKAVKGSVNEGW